MARIKGSDPSDAMSDVFDPGFEQRTIGALVREQALRQGRRPWVLFGDEQLSFAGVDERVDRCASGLLDLGVTHGSRVAVMLPNSPSFLVLALALGRLGAIFVPVNLALKGESLRHVLRQSDASVLAVERSLLPRVARVSEDLPLLRTVLVDGPEPNGISPPLRAEVSELATVMQARTRTGLPISAADTFDPWCVMFTSGTTGPAKGAIMTHQYWFLVPSTLSGPGRDARQDDVFYVSAPMFHAGVWLVQIIPSLLLGCPVAIDEGFSTSQFWDRVRHYGATQLLTMGATHIWLWNEAPTAADADNPARVWAPIPLPSSLHEPFKKRFGIEHLWTTYGGTEFMSVAATDVRHTSKPDSSGQARPSVQLAVLDDLGRPLPPGAIGELCVRPTEPHAIFQGYLGMPEETLRRFRDLWYHTGDLVQIDEDGEVFFVDRKDDYLRVRGENVSSFDVETAFNRHPAVAESAAFSISSTEAELVKEDEIMVALVLDTETGATPEDILRFAADELPHFAVPRYLEFVDDLPRTQTGRVQKNVLRERGLTANTLDRVRMNLRLER